MKTCREEKKSLHFFAPEYGGKTLSLDSDASLHTSVVSLILTSLILPSAVANVTTAVDIYSFGMCALEVRGVFCCSELLVAALSPTSMFD